MIREVHIMEYMERKRWVFFGLPFTFTKYIVKEDCITINRGFLNKVENDCYMYKIQDVTLKQSFFERLVNIGTIVCYTGDSTHPELRLEHIKNSRTIKAFILKESEEARLKRRTINTLDIGSGAMDDLEPADV